MASDNEPAKLLLPYLQRADELQKHEPLVAYYCRLYAMERGLKIPQSERTKTTNSILISLMKQLEKDKKSLQLGPDDNLHLEGFASSVFAKADRQDRAGKADNNTAKTFYAASIFFEILNQFGEVQPDLEQKQKYAVWKAADIRKAIKEGRKPVPGPPGGEKDLSHTSSSEFDSELSRIDPPTRATTQSGPSSQLFDKADPQNYTDFFPSPPSNIPAPPPPHQPPSPPSHMPPLDIPPSPTYPRDEYSSQNFQRLPSINRAEDHTHAQSYNHHPHPLDPQQHLPQDYQSQDPQQHLPQNFPSQEPQHHLPKNYPSQEPQNHLPQSYPSHQPPLYSLPNFQSYPSFSESTLPTAPSNYPPPYYQGSDAPYSSPSASGVTSHVPTAQYNSSSTNGAVPETAPTPPAQVYQYDNNYQPPPEKIAEAHKAARFAVGALAFDDVFIAVDYLKKSLELLTNPSAGH